MAQVVVPGALVRPAAPIITHIWRSYRYEFDHDFDDYRPIMTRDVGLHQPEELKVGHAVLCIFVCDDVAGLLLPLNHEPIRFAWLHTLEVAR